MKNMSLREQARAQLSSGMGRKKIWFFLIPIILIIIAATIFVPLYFKEDAKAGFMQAIASQINRNLDERYSALENSPNAQLFKAFTQDRVGAKTTLNTTASYNTPIPEDDPVVPYQPIIDYMNERSLEVNFMQDIPNNRQQMLTDQWEFIFDNNMIALKSPSIGSKYITMPNQSLQEKLQSYGINQPIDTYALPNREAVDRTKIDGVMKRYAAIIDENMSSNQFEVQNWTFTEKNQTFRGKMYTLTLDTEGYKTLYRPLLTELSQDDETVRLISEQIFPYLEALSLVDSQRTKRLFFNDTDIDSTEFKDELKTLLTDALTSANNCNVMEYVVRMFVNDDGEIIKFNLDKSVEDRETLEVDTVRIQISNIKSESGEYKRTLDFLKTATTYYGAAYTITLEIGNIHQPDLERKTMGTSSYNYSYKIEGSFKNDISLNGLISLEEKSKDSGVELVLSLTGQAANDDGDLEYDLQLSNHLDGMLSNEKTNILTKLNFNSEHKNIGQTAAFELNSEGEVFIPDENAIPAISENMTSGNSL